MQQQSTSKVETTNQKLVLGGGCFWCLEAVYQQVEGVVHVRSGYAAGKTIDPSYSEVCSGTSGHAEVIEISFDPSRVSLESLLSVFFDIHDPTSLNRQGNDCGTQYRSIICYKDKEQELTAEKVIAGQQSNFSDRIVTELVALEVFYPAEIDHQNYYQQNSSQPYCQIVIKPKLEKLIKWKEKNI